MIVDAPTGGRVVAIADYYEPFIDWATDETDQAEDDEEVYAALEHVAGRVRIRETTTTTQRRRGE